METGHVDQTEERVVEAEPTAPVAQKKAELVPLEPESDDEEKKQSQASTAPASRSRSAKGPKWKPERKVERELKKFHASLVKALSDDKSQTELDYIPRTSGLQGEMAEALYRSRRVVHNSPVVQAPKEPLAGRKIRDAIRWEGGLDPNRPLCPHKVCKLVANESHMQNFLHECPHLHLCEKQWESSHRRFFWHPPNPMLAVDTGEKGWKAENLRSACLPEFSAAVYQNHVPRVSNCPRAGFRPQMGTTEAIQIRDTRKKDVHSDTVSVAVTGIEKMWTEKDFMSFVKTHTHAYVFGVQIERSFGYATGTGFVRFGTYEDAQKFIQELDGQACGAYVLQVRYAETGPTRQSLKAPTAKPRAPKRSWEEEGPDTEAVLNFNRLVRSCGPYCEDAAAVVQRMKREGHRPDANTYALLIRSYGACDPPKAAKAEAVLEQMLDDGVQVTAAACNAAVDAWAKVGNMRRAEGLVKRMEDSKGVARTTSSGSEERRLPLPNHETYEVLTHGWQRCGLMDEVGELTKGHLFPKEFFPREHTRRPQTVFNSGCATDQAPALVASWARRRSGFLAHHAGLMVPARPDKSSSLFKGSKWRPLC